MHVQLLCSPQLPPELAEAKQSIEASRQLKAQLRKEQQQQQQQQAACDTFHVAAAAATERDCVSDDHHHLQSVADVLHLSQPQPQQQQYQSTASHPVLPAAPTQAESPGSATPNSRQQQQQKRRKLLPLPGTHCQHHTGDQQALIISNPSLGRQHNTEPAAALQAENPT
jgi:hypothetical protein